MKTYTFEGKTKEAAVELALEELKISEEDLIINNITEKSGLLKKSVEIEVLNINEIITFIKETISKITKLMGTESNLEVRRRDNSISVTIFSDNNSILIGKNGKNGKVHNSSGIPLTNTKDLVENKSQIRKITLQVSVYKKGEGSTAGAEPYITVNAAKGE